MRKQYPTFAACVSNVGKKRQKNEDDFYIYGYTRNESRNEMKPMVFERSLLDRWNSPWQFYAVFDGMGGGNYGEVASQTAARGASECIKENKIHPFDISISLQTMCNELNEQVFRTAMNLGTNKMGTTLSSLFFYKGLFWVCNLGDSKAFLLRKGKLYQISKDHTDEVEMQQNNITGRKPYVTQYLGVDPLEMRLEPYIQSFEMQENDWFLICSDGLTDMVPKEHIQRIMSNSVTVEVCTRKLLDAALSAGGIDNITIMVIA